MPLVHYLAHGGDVGTPDGPRIPKTASAPVGAICPEATALLYAVRWGGAQHGAARDCAKPTGLQAHSSYAAPVNKEALHIGLVAFIHRFGSSLNQHVHFYVCVIDGVFE